MHRSGEVILATVQFADSAEAKLRPAVVLFEDLGNIVVAGITSNPDMKGIPLFKREGAVKDSVIKTNYLLTISSWMIKKKLFMLSKDKRKMLFEDLVSRLQKLEL